MRRLSMGLVLAFAGVISIASGQCLYNAPQPTSESCTIIGGQAAYFSPVNGIFYISVPTGTGTFSTLNNGTTPCFQNFSVTALNITSADPVLGVITTTVDPTRAPSVSRVMAVTMGAAFPAVEDLFIPIQVVVASQPGYVLRSVGEVHLRGTINSWPQLHERLTLAAPVALENPGRPGVVVYTITSLTVQF